MLIKKLCLKTQNPILIINSPTSFDKIIKEINAQIDTSIKQNYDFIMLFAKDKNEADVNIQDVLNSLNHDGILWFCYPKKSSKIFQSDIDRNNSWDLFKPYSFRPVSQISIDEDWSALRFRALNLVGK